MEVEANGAVERARPRGATVLGPAMAVVVREAVASRVRAARLPSTRRAAVVVEPGEAIMVFPIEMDGCRAESRSQQG